MTSRQTTILLGKRRQGYLSKSPREGVAFETALKKASILSNLYAQAGLELTTPRSRVDCMFHQLSQEPRIIMLTF